VTGRRTSPTLLTSSRHIDSAVGEFAATDTRCLCDLRRHVITTPPTAAVTRRKPPIRLVRTINPLMRRLLRSPAHRWLDGAVLVLHITGRRSGRHYDIPVGYHQGHGSLWVFTDSPWRANLRRGADIYVTLHAVRTPMRAELEEHPEHVAKVYAERIKQLGWQAAQRRLGIKIHVSRTPTHEELVDMIHTTGMSIISLTPQ
jgi:hypothetical protein